MSRPPVSSDALERLLAERGWLLRLAHALVRDPAAADDLAQETWLAAVRTPPTSSAHPRAWLGTVLRRMAARRVRSDERQARREGAVARREPQDLDPAAALERADLRRRVVDAVMALDEPYRTTVVLRWFEERTVAEIAAALGVTEAAVRSRLRRALEQLRGRLDEDHDGQRAAWCLPLLAWLDAARPTVPATAGAGTLATLGGAALMTAKTKLVVAALALVALVAWSISAIGPSSDHVGPVRTADGGSPLANGGTADANGARASRPNGDATSPQQDATTLPVLPPDRERDVHGEVVTASGAAVAGARITALDAAGRRVWLPGDPAAEERPEGPSTTTGADGTFRLRLDAGQVVDLRVVAAGCAELEMPHVAAGERVRITVRPGVGVRVTVTDARGTPVAGAAVEVRRGPQTPDVAFLRRATTDADGRAVFDGLPPGVRATVSARHPRHPVGPLTWVDLPGSGRAEATVVLPDGRTVRGTVVSAADGAPLVGATVGTALNPDAVRTVAGGAFELTGVPVGAAVIRATGPGHAPARVEVGPEEDDVRLELPPAPSLVGRVVDTDGAPVPAAQVSGQVWVRGPSGLPARQADASATTDAEGRFRLDGLPGDVPVTLVLRRAGYGRTLRDVPAASADVPERQVGDLVLAPAAGLDVVVAWSGGEPAARVAVTLTGANDDRGSARGAPPTLGALEQRRTDDLGRVRFEDLAPGTYALTVRPEGSDEVERSVRIDGARSTERVGLAGGPELAVRVQETTGAPIAGIAVSVEDRSGAVLRAISAADGVARFRPGPRPWSVQVPSYAAEQAGWLAPGPAAVADGVLDAVVELVRGVPFRARLVLPDGGPLPNAHVHCSVRGADGAVRRATTVLSGDDGSLAWTVPAGARIDARLTGIGRGTLQDVQAGRGDRELPWAGAWTGLTVEDEATLHVTAVARDALRVRVLTPDGAPVPGATVVTRVGDRLVVDGGTRTGVDGRTSLADLPRRERGVEVDLSTATLPPGDWLDPAPVRATPGGDEVVLRLRPAASISGRLVRTDGQALDYGGVEVRHGDDLIGQATAHGDGRFRVLVPRDAPGPLTVAGFTYDRARNRHVGSTSGIWAGADDVVIELATEE